jgi:hypothetical protein
MIVGSWYVLRSGHQRGSHNRLAVGGGEVLTLYETPRRGRTRSPREYILVYEYRTITPSRGQLLSSAGGGCPLSQRTTVDRVRSPV